MDEGGRRCSQRLKSRSSYTPPIEKPAKKSRLSSKRKSNAKQEEPSTNQEEAVPQLSDECWLQVFKQLDPKTLCLTADVSKHFRELSNTTFSEKFDELHFYAVDRLLFRRILRKFGCHISSINFSQTVLSPADVSIISKYCINLEQLSCRFLQINCDDFKPVFARLKHLCLVQCDFYGDCSQLFAACTKLEQFELDAKKYHDIPKCLFPQLSQLRFECEYAWKYSYLWQLLKLNPQIRCLTIVVEPDDGIITNIVQHAKHVEQLFIEQGYLPNKPKEQSREGLLQLANLSSLKLLSMHTSDGKYGRYADALARRLSMCQVNIEYLYLESFQIYRKDLMNILKLNHLQRLVLDTMEELTDDDLVTIAIKLPSLKQLRIEVDYNVNSLISVNGLLVMIRYAKILKYLGLIGIRNMNIDQEIFEALAARVAQRGNVALKIGISGCRSTTQLNVPKHIQLEHRSVLQVMLNN